MLTLLLLSLVACNDVWGGDSTQDNPDYAIVDGKQLYFTLELRMPGSSTEVSEGDSFAHSTIDGDLICQWQIPCYGKTVYESVVKFLRTETTNHFPSFATPLLYVSRRNA